MSDKELGDELIPPRYLRLQVVLSDRDADLKQWCWEHPGEYSAAFRLALREWLAHNDTEDLVPQHQTPRRLLLGQPRRVSQTQQPASPPRRSRKALPPSPKPVPTASTASPRSTSKEPVTTRPLPSTTGSSALDELLAKNQEFL